MTGPARAIGLDFGTTTTLLASDGGLFPLGEMRPWLPSLVGYDDAGSIVIGEQAYGIRPERSVRSIKSAITKHRTVVRVTAPRGVREFSADDFIVEVLTEVLRRAAAKGIELTDPGVRISYGCPTVWDHGQRERYVRLLHRAGLPAQLSQLVEEPIAAGVAWLAGHPQPDGTTLRTVVFDMGGGTLDVAVLDLHGGAVATADVLAAVGRAEAGDALDGLIADDLAQRLGVPDLDEREPSRAADRRDLLLAAARTVKERLSETTEMIWAVDRSLFPNNEFSYTRDELETAFAPQWERAVACVRQALVIAHLTAHGRDDRQWPADPDLLASVDLVLLAGGMSRVPLVRRRLRELFGPAPAIEFAAAEPDEAVALGLSVPATTRRVSRHALDADILLEWGSDETGRHSRVLYEANTPIIEPWWVERSWPGEWRFWCRGVDLALPAAGEAVLRVLPARPEAAATTLTLDDRELDGFPVALNGDAFELAIYPSGRIVLVDGAGTHTGRRAP